MAICLWNKDPDFMFLLNAIVACSLPTTMSPVTGIHTMDLFYISKKNFKNLLFDSLTIWIKVVHCHKDRDSKEYPGMYYEILNQTLLTQKYQGSSPNAFYVLEAYGTY